MRRSAGKRVIAFAAACCLLAVSGQRGLCAQEVGTGAAFSTEAEELILREESGTQPMGGALDPSVPVPEQVHIPTGYGATLQEETEPGSTPDTETPGTEPVKRPYAAYLDVDVRHSYPHMDSSYEQGYIPKVEDDTVYLVLPLVADGELRDACLTAELVMGNNAPFVYANYRKEIKKETYLFEKSVDAYVFECRIGLEKPRINGKYPVDVRAHGYTQTGTRVEFSCRIFITISDGISAPGTNGGSAPDPGTDVPGPGGNTPGPGTDVPGPGGNTPGPSGGNTDSTEPSAGEPATEPSTEPAADEPATEPSTGEPATEPVTEPFTEEPATEPAADEPDTGDPSADTPVIDPDVSDGGGGGSYYGGGGGEAAETVHRQPKLMLTENTLADARLLAGQEREFTLSLQNMNTEETIYNLMVSLKTEPDLSLATTSFYYGVVYPKETIELTSVLSAAVSAAAGRSALSLSYEYENSQGNTYSGTEEFSVEVCQSVQAVMEGFSIADVVYAQETVESGVSVRNVGKTAIYNATVELQAQGLFATATLFAGNLEAGASYEGNLRIYVGNKKMTSISEAGAGADDESAYGKTTGTLTLTYENMDGEIFKQTQEFTTVIQKPQIVELHAEKEEEVQTNQWWAAILVMTVLLFLLIVVILLWRLRKSRNAMADLLAVKEGRGAY